MADEWKSIETAPLNREVMTKIDDEHGERNVQSLIGRQRSPECRVMWFFPDDSMYVYYAPTHWKEVA